MTPAVLYIVECLHVMPGTRASEGKITCYNCADLKEIIGVHVYEWHARCRDCNWGRWTGLSKETGHYYARHHAQAKNHECVVTYDQSPEGISAEKRLKNAKMIR